MHLDKSVLSICSELERASALPGYTYVPMLLREEIDSIVLKPVYKFDEKGYLLSVDFEYEVFGNEKKVKTA